MVRTPSVRVAAVRDILAFAGKFQPGAQERVLQTFPSETQDALENASRMAWLPIEHDHWVVDGIIEVLGKEQALRCWRASVPDMVDKPLLRTFISGMLRVIGHDPARVIALFPKSWPLLYNDFCQLDMTVDRANQVTLHFSDIAPQLRQFPNYFVSWNGIVQGLFAVAGVPGHVDMVVSPDVRSARACCTWG